MRGVVIRDCRDLDRPYSDPHWIDSRCNYSFGGPDRLLVGAAAGRCIHWSIRQQAAPPDQHGSRRYLPHRHCSRRLAGQQTAKTELGNKAKAPHDIQKEWSGLCRASGTGKDNVSGTGEEKDASTLLRPLERANLNSPLSQRTKHNCASLPSPEDGSGSSFRKLLPSISNTGRWTSPETLRFARNRRFCSFALTLEAELYTNRTASVVEWSEFLATDPEVRVRFPVLPDFLRSSGSATGSTQPREHN
jgi:hypothetical protein